MYDSSCKASWISRLGSVTSRSILLSISFKVHFSVSGFWFIRKSYIIILKIASPTDNNNCDVRQKGYSLSDSCSGVIRVAVL